MRRTYRVERLARHEERQILKRIFALSIVSIFLIILALTIGISTLGKFADFLSSVFTSNGNDSQVVSFIPPPILDSLSAAVNEEKISVSGISTGGNKVKIFLDSQEVDETEIIDGKFEFADFDLKKGENRIKVRAQDENGNTSEFSQEAVVVFDADEPTLEVTTPGEGQSFEKNNRIKVEGKTEKDAQVFANGFLANVDTDGNFEVTIPLSEGENQITVKALDEAGNTKEIIVKVNFKK